VLGADVDCPSTDKSSIKRAQIYRDFAAVIEDVYVRLENAAADGPLLVLSAEELEGWILEKWRELDLNVPDVEADFFTSGVDSLKAIQMRGLIVKHLDLGGSTVEGMIVYDCGNARKLAAKLVELRVGGGKGDEDEREREVTRKLIDKYSVFEETDTAAWRQPSDSRPESSVVVSPSLDRS
jgi:hypothetical protein